MKIIIGHSNMDLDCFGSMVLARSLYPSYRLVSSHLIHPVARALYNLYQNHLDLLPGGELKNEAVEHVVVVDTRSRKRVEEYLRHLKPGKTRIDVYDHHPADSADIPGAVLHGFESGANTTLLGLEVIERGLTVGPEDATIALTGIYADTGNFSHENVAAEDFRVAAFLKAQGASLKLVRTFLKTLKEEYQMTLFHELLNRLVYREVRGHLIIFVYQELDKQAGGLAAVVEKIFEVENPDALFAVFAFKKEGNALIVARSQKEAIDVRAILARFGGGGHTQAASALLKKTPPAGVLRTLEETLDLTLQPAMRAEKLMTAAVALVRQEWSLKEASLFLERINHTGAPVVDEAGELCGFITLRDIMKGRKADLMHAPVKAYMTRRVITGLPETTMRELETLMFHNNIGHLPITAGSEGAAARRVVGIVTRSDYLRFAARRQVPETGRTDPAAPDAPTGRTDPAAAGS
jgi:tRNA nucleotidyltransferase (CCA-adding enzyme)